MKQYEDRTSPAKHQNAALTEQHSGTYRRVPLSEEESHTGEYR